MLPLNTIVCGDNVKIMRQWPDECIDLVVTSPPYDNVYPGPDGRLIIDCKNGLRTYEGYEWDFVSVAAELWRVTKPGGVVVWVVGDATVNGSETGSSFRQVLYFMELGFKLWDTMIYQKSGVLGGAGNPPLRYSQDTEYMFILTKGKLKSGLPNLIKIKSNNAGKKITGTTRRNRYKDDGGLDAKKVINSNGKPTNEYKVKSNVWIYDIGWMHTTADKEAFEQSGIFPEALAHDHVISWSNPGDIILDPFSGSGTVAKMTAILGRNYIGLDCSERSRIAWRVETDGRQQ